jgi:universal stress protein A
MSGYTTILVGLDFTDEGRRALERAADVSRRYGSTLHVAHVIEHFPEDIPVDIVPREDLDVETALVDRAREKAAALIRDLGLDDVSIVVEVTRRSAKHKLIELAASVRPDLIVVGGAGEAGLGSTAGGIIHNAPCDVLVVRA